MFPFGWNHLCTAVAMFIVVFGLASIAVSWVIHTALKLGVK